MQNQSHCKLHLTMSYENYVIIHLLKCIILVNKVKKCLCGHIADVPVSVIQKAYPQV